MFKKALAYTGKYRKTTYAAIAFMIIGVAMTVVPYFVVYQLILPLLGYGDTLSVGGITLRIAIVGLCGVLYAVLYVHGLSLSHVSAYHTLKNLRISLQTKLESQPLGTIQSKGVGEIKKIFIDDIETIELLLAHAIPEGLSNFAVPGIVYLSMFFVDWKLALLSLCSLPAGLLTMGFMYKSGKSKMDSYYGAAKRMNSTIIEYINGMEVVKIFNRDGESYKRFEKDVHSYRDFTLLLHMTKRKSSMVFHLRRRRAGLQLWSVNPAAENQRLQSFWCTFTMLRAVALRSEVRIYGT